MMMIFFRPVAAGSAGAGAGAWSWAAGAADSVRAAGAAASVAGAGEAAGAAVGVLEVTPRGALAGAEAFGVLLLVRPWRGLMGEGLDRKDCRVCNSCFRSHAAGLNHCTKMQRSASSRSHE